MGDPNSETMSTGGKSIGIPIKLLHEAEGHTITLETKTGEVFRGQLLESEDNMNCYIGSVTMTARDGRTSKLEQVAIRGSQVRFMILPDRLWSWQSGGTSSGYEDSYRKAISAVTFLSILHDTVGRKDWRLRRDQIYTGSLRQSTAPPPAPVELHH